MLSFMHAQHALFQQGYGLLDDLRPYMQNLAAQVRPRPHLHPRRLAVLSLALIGLQLDQLVIDSAVEKREMERKHATVQQRVSPRPSLVAAVTVSWLAVSSFCCDLY